MENPKANIIGSVDTKILLENLTMFLNVFNNYVETIWDKTLVSINDKVLKWIYPWDQESKKLLDLFNQDDFRKLMRTEVHSKIQWRTRIKDIYMKNCCFSILESYLIQLKLYKNTDNVISKKIEEIISELNTYVVEILWYKDNMWISWFETFVIKNDLLEHWLREMRWLNQIRENFTSQEIENNPNKKEIVLEIENDIKQCLKEGINWYYIILDWDRLSLSFIEINQSWIIFKDEIWNYYFKFFWDSDKKIFKIWDKTIIDIKAINNNLLVTKSCWKIIEIDLTK